jgi:hypothetical protein
MKNNTVIKISLLLAVVFLLSACSIPFISVVRGSGDVETETREVSGFSKIEMNGAGQLIITQGSTESLDIEAEDNVLPELTSEVKGETLVLGYKNQTWRRSVIPTKPIIYTLTVVDLSEITFNGAGDLEMDSLNTASLEITINGAGNIEIGNLQADELSVTISGTGSIRIAGEVESQSINIEGAGNYQATDLLSQKASIEVNGLGNSKLWVMESLDVAINGGGSVDYYGDPNLTQDINGLGNVNHLGEK